MAYGGPVVGNVASGAADSGAPVKTGGVYHATPPTLSDGQRGDTELDPSGNTKTVVENGLQAALHVSTKSVSSNTPVQVFSGAGIIRNIKAANAGGALAYVNYWDSVSAPTPGTTALYDADPLAANGGGCNYPPATSGIPIANGLWINCATTRNGTSAAATALDVTIAYDQ